MEIIKVNHYSETYTLFVTPGKQVEIHTHDKKGRITEVKIFWVGDRVEYDSFNLRYSAPIKNITANSVIIDLKDCCAKSNTKRMSFSEFARRNHDFDLQELNRYNDVVSICL